MRFSLFGLGKSEKLGLDNKDFNIFSLQDKLREEYKEVMYEVDIVRIYRNTDDSRVKTHKSRLASELLDLMQVCIAGLIMLAKDGVDIKIAVFKHNFKLLKEREWTIDKIFNIEVCDGDMGDQWSN